MPSELERGLRADEAHPGLRPVHGGPQPGPRAHAGELLLRSDPGLADELAADRLSPLADLSPGSRRRLRGTLAVWLAEQGRLGVVAERLGIHPQTARYRVGRLRELFGEALEDPEGRFELALALRAHRLRATRGALPADAPHGLRR